MAWCNIRTNRFLDQMLLLIAGVGVAILAYGAFVLGDKLQINPFWIFLAGNSVIFIAKVGWDFRARFRSISFTVFFSIWVIVHSFVVTLTMALMPWYLWLAVFWVELVCGFFVAYRFWPQEPGQRNQ